VEALTVADEVREHVVAALLLGQPVEASGAERAMARDAAVTAARLWQDEHLLPRGRSVTDMTLREAICLTAVFNLLSGYWPQPALEGKKLSDVLKVVPADVAESARFWLHWGGYADYPDARLRQFGGLRLDVEEDSP
jgi:hypothetical protein